MFLRPEDRADVRQHQLDTVRASLSDGEALSRLLDPKYNAVLYQLVFDPGNETGAPVLNDVGSWSWLGPIILDSLRRRDVCAATNAGVLLGARVSGRDTVAVDSEVLFGFFGHDAQEAVEILDDLIDQIEDSEHGLIRNVIDAARQEMAQQDSESCGRIWPAVVTETNIPS